MVSQNQKLRLSSASGKQYNNLKGYTFNVASSGFKKLNVPLRLG